MSGATTQASGKAAAGAKVPVRSAQEIETELNQTRDRLSSTFAQIEDRISPRNVFDNQKARVRAIYFDDNGVRVDRVAMTAGAVVAAAIGLRLTSKTVRWLFAAPKPPSQSPDIVYLPVSRAQIALFNAPSGQIPP